MSLDSYCIWVSSPSPASSPSRPPQKSGSTGPITRWRRISELVISHSHSDSKEKFRFISALSSPAREHPKPKPTTKGATATKPRSSLTAAKRPLEDEDDDDDVGGPSVNVDGCGPLYALGLISSVIADGAGKHRRGGRTRRRSPHLRRPIPAAARRRGCRLPLGVEPRGGGVTPRCRRPLRRASIALLLGKKGK
ncbi:uncharacterized protein LOC127772973 [Oryza glaberrima]|uniref:Uncharacterized protein n=1 Tax=Oryza glaberrima TaxID=4538 RepID=I1PT24_ORYGL|nr:uncharacterized protein LOC127772973 [Oryza glaberrima]